MRSGMTLAEREAARQKLRDYALTRALHNQMSPYCRYAAEIGDAGECRPCTWERPGATGCLCECHDKTPHAEVLSRSDGQPVSAP